MSVTKLLCLGPLRSFVLQHSLLTLISFFFILLLQQTRCLQIRYYYWAIPVLCDTPPTPVVPGARRQRQHAELVPHIRRKDALSELYRQWQGAVTINIRSGCSRGNETKWLWWGSFRAQGRCVRGMGKGISTTWKHRTRGLQRAIKRVAMVVKKKRMSATLLVLLLVFLFYLLQCTYNKYNPPFTETLVIGSKQAQIFPSLGWFCTFELNQMWQYVGWVWHHFCQRFKVLKLLSKKKIGFAVQHAELVPHIDEKKNRIVPIKARDLHNQLKSKSNRRTVV